MALFNISDLSNITIDKMVYNEFTDGWDFEVKHNGISYTFTTYDLPHPDEVTDGQIGQKVTDIMLTLENKSYEEPKKKRVFVVEKTELSNKPLSELPKETYEKPDQNNFLVYDRVGDQSFFTDGSIFKKYNIHVIFNKDKKRWDFGRYNYSEDWTKEFEESITVNVNGEKITLNKDFTWDFLDQKTPSNIFEINQIIDLSLILDERGPSKYNVHLKFNTDNLTWTYGPENVDYEWMAQGRSIWMNGSKISTSLIQDEKTGWFIWSYI